MSNLINKVKLYCNPDYQQTTDDSYNNRNINNRNQTDGSSNNDMYPINKQFVSNTSVKSPECIKSRNGYTCYDSRLVNPMRGVEPLELDSPSFNSKPVNLYDIYNPTFGSYMYNYKSYEDVDAGNIIYNFIPRRRDVFSQPVFSNTSNVKSYLYRDPMDSVKPVYVREPIITTNKISEIKQKTDRCNLTWLRDTNEHREDIISKQMYKINQRKIEPLV